MGSWWIINDRHEVIKVASEMTQAGDGRWYVEALPGWFWEGQSLFDSETAAKLRAIEQVLSRGLTANSPPLHHEVVRTAAGYAKEFRDEVTRLRAALADIVSRCEERDTGTGYYVESGSLALAIHRVAKQALEG